MEDEFYDKIVYKKNAYSQMHDDLCEYYVGRKALIITTKSLINSNFTEIMNCVSSAGLSFETFVAKNNFSEVELNKLSELLTQQNFDIYIAYGGGKTCDVAKYFSNIFCVPFFMCPSACSTFGYFNNICINPYNSTRSFVCDGAERIYISDSAIRKTPRYLVKQGALCIISAFELLCVATIENILLDKHIDMTEISKCIAKLKKELPLIMTGESDSKLVLMDILIDFAYALKDVNLFESSAFNLYLIMKEIFDVKCQVVGSGECLMIASKVLLECYKNLFLQKKIKQYEVPNFVKIAKNIEKNTIFCKKINNFSFFVEILSKNELLIRLNNLKEEFLFQTNKNLELMKEMLNCVKKYEDVFAYDTPIIKDIFYAVSILPFICDNNYLITVMAAMGYFNNF